MRSSVLDTDYVLCERLSRQTLHLPDILRSARFPVGPSPAPRCFHRTAPLRAAAGRCCSARARPLGVSAGREGRAGPRRTARSGAGRAIS